MSPSRALLVSMIVHIAFGVLLSKFSLHANSNQMLEVGINQEITPKKYRPKSNSNIKSNPEKLISNTLNEAESNQSISKTINAEVEESKLQNQSEASQYARYLFEEISRRKLYPTLARKLKHEGLVLAQITIAKDGKILSKKILKTTESEILNQEVARLLSSLDEFNKFPENISKESWEFIIPIEFSLQH